MTAELDQLFGESLPAGKPILPHEEAKWPRSIVQLTAETAPHLLAYLDREHPMELPKLYPESCHVLWLIDRQGEIWFAAEELIDSEGQFIGVMPRSLLAKPRTTTKLGHPSLLPDKSDLTARIGGELVYDPVDGKDWCITNASGRYGTRPGQTEDHLEAAARKFTEHGIHCWVYFITPGPA